MIALCAKVESWRSGLKAIDRTDLRFYILTCLLAVGLKIAWRNCQPTEPRIFLAPLVAILRLLLGTSFALQPDGYWNQAWGVTIAKGCGGMNYFLILHCLLVFSHLRTFRGRAKLVAFSAFLVGAFLLTIVANVSRIMSALMLGRTGLAPSVLTGEPHLALGTFVYFFFLLAGNGLAGILIRQRNRRMEGSH